MGMAMQISMVITFKRSIKCSGTLKNFPTSWKYPPHRWQFLTVCYSTLNELHNSITGNKHAWQSELTQGSAFLTYVTNLLNNMTIQISSWIRISGGDSAKHKMFTRTLQANTWITLATILKLEKVRLKELDHYLSPATVNTKSGILHSITMW